ITGGRTNRENRVQPREVRGRYVDARRRDVLLQIAHVLGAGNRNDVFTAREHPRERKLSWRHSLLTCQLLHFAHQLQVSLEVLALEARVSTSEVVRCQVL